MKRIEDLTFTVRGDTPEEQEHAIQEFITLLKTGAPITVILYLTSIHGNTVTAKGQLSFVRKV